MATRTMPTAVAAPMDSTAFEQFAGLCAIIAGILGFLYSVAFIFLKNDLLYGLFQMLGGVLTTAVLVALYYRLRETDEAFALWAVLIGLVGSLGAAIHGGYDLANAVVRPSAEPFTQSGAAFAVDPRGLLTFGVSGVAVFVLAWLMARSGRFPKNLAYVGYALGVLLIVLYLGRMIVFTATNLVILVPALLTGFILNPLWYIWLGVQLWRGRSA